MSTKNVSTVDGASFGDIFDWLVELCNLIIEIPQPMMALRCLLHCGFSASEEAGLEDTAYDCFEEVISTFPNILNGC